MACIQQMEEKFILTVLSMQLVALPCKNNVDGILEEYVKQKTSKGNNPNK